MKIQIAASIVQFCLFALLFLNVNSSLYSNSKLKSTIWTKDKRTWVSITEDKKIIADERDLKESRLTPKIKQIHNAKEIFSTAAAFAVLTENQKVYTWGQPEFGGEIPEEIKQILRTNKVKKLFSNIFAFSVLLENNNVLAWGFKYSDKYLREPVENVKNVFSNEGAFVALRHDGTIFAWGSENWGGKLPRKIENVKNVFATKYSFAALLENGSVYAWGKEEYGGKLSFELTNVKLIVPNNFAFVALFETGGAFSWGDESYGGNLELEGKINTIVANDGAFVALFENGDVKIWGHQHYGSKIPEYILKQLKNNVKSVHPKVRGFRFLLKSFRFNIAKFPCVTKQIEYQLVRKNISFERFHALKEEGENVSFYQPKSL